MDNKARESRWVIVRAGGPGRASVITAAALPAGVRAVPLDAGLCEADVTANVTMAVSASDDEAIRFEIAKLAYQDHWRPLGYACQLLQAGATTSEAVAGKPDDPGDAEQVAVALRALLSHKMPVAGWRRQVIAAWLRAIVPAFAALPLPTWLGMRHGGSAPPAAKRSPIWHAVHGERETRTRHLLPPAYDPQPSRVYLILGRPRESLDKVRRTIDPSGTLAQMDLIRPMNVASCLRAMPRAASRIGKLVTVLSRSPISAAPRDVAALSFRLVQGEAHRVWWAHLKDTPEDVIFAHTGTADTTALERAIQVRGGRTHHLAHGVNTGWPFAAVSNTATFVCGHDAEVARRLPAYGATRHNPMVPPPLQPGDGRWLILTAYTHPMGRPYASFGVQPDIDALDAVAAAAHANGVPAEKVVWRPHPAIAKVSAADRSAVERRAASHGFTLWPAEEPLAAMANYSVVITTPSTALLDALFAGKLPVLLATVPLQSDLLYASYPLRASRAEDLATAAARTNDGATYRSAWSAMAPGNPPRSPLDLAGQAAGRPV